MAGWKDFPPTSILLKGLLEGLAGENSKAPKADYDNLPPEAMKAMQDSAMQAIQAKAGSRLPVTRGKDKGLPSKPPSFDVDELRSKNDNVAKNFRKGI